MERRLHQWFLTQRSRHIPISYEIIAAKAKQLYVQIYGKHNFVASRGWIANFRARHGVRSLKISGEVLSNNQAAIDPFLEKLETMIKNLNLTADQVYNADESALFWKLLPDRTMVGSHEKTAPGRKTSKERITFLLCTNGSGTHKLEPLVIGKAANPRAFKNAKIPVLYKSSSNAWMTSCIFKDWFHHHFIKEVKRFLITKNLPQRAVLIIDNASSHASEEDLNSKDANFIIMFLPPNCTALIQPLDQNAIRLTKLFYRKSLLAEIMSSDEKDVIKCLKNINIKDAVCFLYNAWQKVSAGVIKKCWKKILPYQGDNSQDEEYDSEDSMPLAELRQKLRSELEDVRNMFSSISEEQLTEGEIDEGINGDENLLPIEESCDGEANDAEVVEADVGSNKRGVKHGDAINGFNVCLEWAEENQVALQDILALRRLRESKNHKKRKTNYYF
jgi:hypothetical protein